MTHRADILTLGCRVNHYESEALREELRAVGIGIATSHDEKCDIYIVNSCAVTEESVRKTRQLVRRAVKKSGGGFVAITGCASQAYADDFLRIDGVSAVFGSRNKRDVLRAVAGYINGLREKTVLVSPPDGEIENFGISAFDRTRAYVKIEDGCDGRCAYCIIPRVRGRVVLRDSDEIIAEVGRLAANGCREVVLTGIETAAYGNRLAGLIAAVAGTSGIERVRLGSMEPSYLKKEFVDSLSEIPQFCHHMHVSVQSGSNRVLALMRRKYNRQQLEKNLDYIRSVMPDFNFSADIIVGFPGETEDDFRQTMELVKKYGFIHCHIFRFSERPGTEAADMVGKVPPEVCEKRLHRLETLASVETGKALRRTVMAGKPVPMLCETYKNGIISGHTDRFEECAVRSPVFEKGRTVIFVPEGVSDGKLTGKLADKEND